MNEFNDTSTEFSETDGIDVPETSDWTDFDPAGTDDINIDTAESIGAGATPDLSLASAFDDNDIQSEAEKAADYARSLKDEQRNLLMGYLSRGFSLNLIASTTLNLEVPRTI